MTIKEFVKNRHQFFWYIKNPENLNNDSIVEHILNYGDWSDVQELIKTMGMNKVAQIFRSQINQERTNYNKKIINYFKLYFNKYV